MPLSDDQRALLRLLAQREQGYEDIGALMGLSVEQVRARVLEALATLDEAGEPAEAGAPPREAVEPPPDANAGAQRGQTPEPLSPEAISHGDAPRRQGTATEGTKGAAEPPGEPPKAPPAPPKPSRPSRPAEPSSPRLALPGDRRRLIELAGGALAVILLVLFATGLVDIGGNGDSESTTTAAPPTEAPAAAGRGLTQAVLKPVGGGDAIGRALFGRVGKNVVLQVVAQGLEPSPPGQSYTVWLYRSPKLVLRVGAAKVVQSGGLAARFPIPAELLAYVAGGAFDQIDVSLTSDTAYKTEVARARREERLPPYTGTDILRGEITGPIIKK